MPSYPDAMPPAGARPPAGHRARGGGGRVPAGVREPDLRQPSRRGGRAHPARGAGGGVAPGGHAAVDPARRGRPLLRHPLELEGIPARAGAHGAPHRRDALWRWTDGGRLPVVTDASSCAHGLIQDVGPVLDEDARARFAGIEVLDSTVWAHDHLLPRLDVRERVASVAVHPTCSAGHMGVAGQAGGRDGRAGRRGGGAVGAGCCGMAGTAGCSTPSCPSRRCGREGEPGRARVRRSRVLQPHLRDRAPAGDGRPYASFVFMLERLTRPS